MATDGKDLTHGYWFVAYLDLLGIRRALLNTDYLPGDDPAKQEALLAAMSESVGAILRMRQWLANYFTGRDTADPDEQIFAGLPEEKVARARRMQQTRVRRDRISDGIVVACPLESDDGHFPIRGVYDAIGACACLMLVQLAAGKPVRGGLDVGTGIEIEEELFGAACVKAYELESKRAKFPRLVVGQGLVDYLRSSKEAPGQELEGQFERRMAEGQLGLLRKDFDGEWIVDYAGPFAHRLFGGTLPALLAAARGFAHPERERFQQGADDESRKLFERYSHLVRYLDASGP